MTYGYSYPPDPEPPRHGTFRGWDEGCTCAGCVAAHDREEAARAALDAAESGEEEN